MKLIPLLVLVLWIHSANAENQDTYHFVSLGLTDGGQLASEHAVSWDDKLIPELSFGLGQSSPLSDDWQIDTELSLTFAETNQPVTAFHFQPASLTNVGIWGTARLKQTSLFDSAHPFLEMALGVVHVDEHFAGQKYTGEKFGLKLHAGIEFTLTESMSLSIAAGQTNHF